jgi:hypothetical protein
VIGRWQTLPVKLMLQTNLAADPAVPEDFGVEHEFVDIPNPI